MNVVYHNEAKQLNRADFKEDGIRQTSSFINKSILSNPKLDRVVLPSRTFSRTLSISMTISNSV